MPSLDDYASMVRRDACRKCGGPLADAIDAYTHPEGWHVEGFSERQWLSVHCEACGYDWSLWKLGVPIQ